MVNNQKLLRTVGGLAACLIAAAFLSTCDKVDDNCGGKVPYDPLFQFCFGDQPYALCGGKSYNPLTQECSEGVVFTATEWSLAVSANPPEGGDVYVNSVLMTDTTATTTHDAGAKVGVLAVPAQGFRFTGWTGASESKDSASITLTMSGNFVLTANFHSTYRLTLLPLDSPYGSVGANKTDDIAGNEQIAIWATPEDGYCFHSWTVGNGVAVADRSSSRTTVTLSENATVTANFASRFTVSFDTETGSFWPIDPIGQVTVDSGRTVGASFPEDPTTPNTAVGYIFEGWFSGDTRYTETTQIIGNVTLTAKWTKVQGNQYRVSFDTDGGAPSSISSVAVDSGGTMGTQFPANPTKDGYVFDGWYQGTMQYTAETKMLQDVTLTARWKLVDSRDDNKTVYSTVTIGAQTWMAENLNYETAEGSWCYDDVPANCETYGRLYNWKTAKTACPSGWHLPDTAEWKELVLYAGGVSAAYTKLRSKSGWTNDLNGTDVYGFTALPGGHWYPVGAGYRNSGIAVYFWSSSIHYDDYGGEDEIAYAWTMVIGVPQVEQIKFYESARMSVRCVQNKD